MEFIMKKNDLYTPKQEVQPVKKPVEKLPYGLEKLVKHATYVMSNNTNNTPSSVVITNTLLLAISKTLPNQFNLEESLVTKRVDERLKKITSIILEDFKKPNTDKKDYLTKLLKEVWVEKEKPVYAAKPVAAKKPIVKKNKPNDRTKKSHSEPKVAPTIIVKKHKIV
jgi:hypothetical protein